MRASARAFLGLQYFQDKPVDASPSPQPVQNNELQIKTTLVPEPATIDYFQPSPDPDMYDSHEKEVEVEEDDEPSTLHSKHDMSPLDTYFRERSTSERSDEVRARCMLLDGTGVQSNNCECTT